MRVGTLEALYQMSLTHFVSGGGGVKIHNYSRNFDFIVFYPDTCMVEKKYS